MYKFPSIRDESCKPERQAIAGAGACYSACTFYLEQGKYLTLGATDSLKIFKRPLAYNAVPVEPGVEANVALCSGSAADPADSREPRQLTTQVYRHELVVALPSNRQRAQATQRTCD